MLKSNSLARRIMRNLRPTRLWSRLGHGRYSWLKFRAKGMLDPSTYKEIRNRVACLQEHPFVEIGAAAGAGTVSIAWGFQIAGNRSPILAIEKCEGGSRMRYGEYSENLNLLNSNLEHFGVRDQVILYTKPISKDDEYDIFARIGSQVICGFMHDADGRLDRDFALFWKKVIPGGLIIVDDCPQVPSLDKLIRERGSKGRKEYITARAWQIITDEKLVERWEWIGPTVFAYKPYDSEEKEIPVRKIEEAISHAEEEFRDALEKSK